MLINSNRWTKLGDRYYRWLDPFLAIISEEEIQDRNINTARTPVVGISIVCNFKMELRLDGIDSSPVAVYQDKVMNHYTKYNTRHRMMNDREIEKVKQDIYESFAGKVLRKTKTELTNNSFNGWFIRRYFTDYEDRIKEVRANGG